MQDNENRNPWLSIPASDYEAHMGENGANQLPLLSKAFKDLLDEFRPESVAVLGCATGNGFEHVEADVTGLLVGIDINPEYLDVARSRFEAKIPNLQLFCSDVSKIVLEPRTIDLVSCGLFFEHVDPELVIAKVLRWLKPGGVFGTVVQLSSATGRSVADTGIESVKALESSARLIDPQLLRDLAEKAGFHQLETKTVALETGTSFQVLVYRLKS